MPVRVVVMGLLVLLALLVKTIVLPAVAIGSYRPDVVTLVVVGVALLEGPDSGLRLGFATGLAQDLVSGGEALVGVGALVMMGVGYAAGRLKPFIVSAPRSGGIVVAGLAAGAATFATGVLGRLLGTVSASLGAVLVATITVGVYSALVAPLVLPGTQRVMRQFPPASA